MKYFAGIGIIFLILALTVPLFLEDCLPGEGSPAGTGDQSLNEAEVPDEFIEWIYTSAEQCDAITPPLIAGQLWQEAKFRTDLTSHAGAEGPAQFLPGTWREWGRDDDGNGRADPRDIGDAVMAMGRYNCHLAEVVADIDGDHPDLMLAAYNAGPGNVLRYRGVPPFEETRTYVSNIKRFAAEKFSAGSSSGESRALPAAALTATTPAAQAAVHAAMTAGVVPAASADTWVIPVPEGTYRISSGFGPRPAPAPGASTFHRGVDFAAPSGTPILAAAAGAVEKTGPASGFGEWVTINHPDGSHTVYGHMYDSTEWVSPGDQVTPGQQIATVGDNGVGTGAHLHFEVWPTGRSGEPVDPLVWLKDKGAEGLDGPQEGAPAENGADECGGDGTGQPADFNGPDAVAPPQRNEDGSWPPEECTEPDPTQDRSGACLTPRTAKILTQIESMNAGYSSVLCWDPHHQNPSSDHPKGAACDFTYGEGGQRAEGDAKTKGDALAKWLTTPENAEKWGVKYVIWYGQIWHISSKEWKDYGGGGVYDPSDPVGGHYTHIHLSML